MAKFVILFATLECISPFQVAVAPFVLMGNVLTSVGYSHGTPSMPIPKGNMVGWPSHQTSSESMIWLEPPKTKILSTVTAATMSAVSLAQWLAFTAADRLGRKKTILLGCTIMAIGTILIASSYSLAQIIGNRLSTATAPVWQTATAQATWRGRLVILELGLNVGGYCLVNCIKYGLSFKEGSIA
ncbi:hypothetical protein BDW66DRAFT_149570 [Aspergillus desertorum]